MFPTLSQLSALASVVMIDVVLAGDNAIVVGMAASGLPPEKRRRAILIGIGAATAMRIGFAAVALQLLEIIGLTLAGGILLLWVSWKMYRDLAAPKHPHDAAQSGEAVAQKTTGRAVTQIVVADLSMSLDNVLAVAGVAHTHAEPWVLYPGLLLSVALMGVASGLIARLLTRYPWVAWIGLAIVVVVALRMIWTGWGQVAAHMGWAS